MHAHTDTRTIENLQGPNVTIDALNFSVNRELILPCAVTTALIQNNHVINPSYPLAIRGVYLYIRISRFQKVPTTHTHTYIHTHARVVGVGVEKLRADRLCLTSTCYARTCPREPPAPPDAINIASRTAISEYHTHT